jgi:hypothetical protein
MLHPATIAFASKAALNTKQRQAALEQALLRAFKA